MPAFSQVPVTPNDSLVNTPNDSIFFENQMAEVVVIGYGTKTAGSITGSVAQVKAADIVRTPAQSAIQAIQGKAAGVNIVTNDEPGANPTIRIRGLGTVTQGREPLYVIDGIETTGLNGISPNDIATIDILKDGSSLAIYGQKGANGVILITTKKGRAGEFKVTYDAYYGQKFIQRKINMADSYRFAYYNNSAIGDPTYFNLEQQPFNTDWLDVITETGEVMSNTVALSGGSENTSLYFSATNYKEKGILSGSAFERTNLLSKNEYRLFNSRLKITQFINVAIQNSTPKPLSAFTNAYKQSPIMPVKYDNGRWGAPLVNEQGFNDLTGQRYNNVDNPAAQLHFANTETRSVTLSGSVGAEYKIMDELKFNSNFGATAGWGRGYNFYDDLGRWLSANPSSDRDDYLAQNPNNPRFNTLTQNKYESYDWNWDNFITYSKYFGDHDVTVVAGMSRTTRGISSTIAGTRYNVPEQTNYWALNFSDDFEEINPATVVSGYAVTPVVSIAYFGRAEYEYKNRYLLTASLRREGISSFAENKRWENFPSVSAGWIVSNEDFMAGVSFLSYLKIRGGYGEVGNAYRGTGGAQSLNQVLFVNAPYPFGNPEIINPGTNSPGQPDRNLSWETMKEIDLGIDFAFLSNRLSGTVDVYNRKTVDVILPVQLPEVLSPDRIFLNTGEVQNRGVEVTLKWQDAIGSDFNYWVGGNISFNKNELTKVDNQYFATLQGGGLGNGAVTKEVLVGQPLGTFYVYDVTGFNSDGAFTYSEKRIAAGSYLPTYTYGANIGATYKGIDLSADIYGVGGNKIYNGKRAQRFGGENIETAILDDFWTPSTPNATNPRPFNDVPRPSTYYIEDGAFLRVNNITLGYTLPKMFEGIDRIRIYVTAVNPFLFTDYSGYSPEIAGGGGGDPLGNAGIELDAYPTNKTYLFGINVGL